MTRAVLTQVQMQRFEVAADAAGSSRRRADDLVNERSNAIDETYELKKKAVDKQQEAREDAGLGSLIGTFILPVIGTFLGKLIGGAVTGGERDEKAALDRQASLADLGQTKLKSEIGDARESLDDAKSDRSSAQKFIRELTSYNGGVS